MFFSKPSTVALAVASCLLLAGELLAAPSVLVLYKSSEKESAKENRAKWHLAASLQAMGCEVAYHDIDQGLPPAAQAASAAAILSWYQGPTMKAARQYCAWLSSQVKRSKRIIVLGNFGAFQDAATEEWLPVEDVNVFFESLGVSYEANWTEAGDQIALASIHPSMALSAKDPVFGKLDYYLQFRSVDSRNRELIKLKRTGDNAGESVVAAFTPHGAMALDPYFARTVNGGKELVFLHRLDRFLRTAMHYQGVQTKRVLALFKSSEKTSERSNEIKWHVEPHLKKLNYRVDYYDIEAGLPDQRYMDQVGAIVSWFRAPEMKNAEAYCRWAAAQVYAGKKLIVLGNFGALREAGKEEWLAGAVVSRSLAALGLDYTGDWTANAKEIELVASDAKLIDQEALKKSFPLIHYYVQYRSLHPKSAKAITIRRNTQANSDSDVIVVTPFGGMAVSNYVFFDGGDGKLLPILNLHGYISRCLAF